MEHGNSVNPSLFIQLAKVQQQNEWKKEAKSIRVWALNM